jgi:hypothetical protein
LGILSCGDREYKMQIGMNKLLYFLHELHSLQESSLPGFSQFIYLAKAMASREFTRTLLTDKQHGMAYALFSDCLQQLSFYICLSYYLFKEHAE